MGSWSDAIKEETMNEYQQGDLSGQMLEHSETNTRYSGAMVPVCTLLYWTTVAWKGKYGKLFEGLSRVLQLEYLNLEGYSRLQAIDISKARVAAPVGPGLGGEESKKGGLLGWLRR